MAQLKKSGSHFLGLASDVRAVAESLLNISSISCSREKGCKGQPSIKIFDKWPSRFVQVCVSDREHGHRKICIGTSRPGPIARIMAKMLKTRCGESATIQHVRYKKNVGSGKTVTPNSEQAAS